MWFDRWRLTKLALKKRKFRSNSKTFDGSRSESVSNDISIIIILETGWVCCQQKICWKYMSWLKNDFILEAIFRAMIVPVDCSKIRINSLDFYSLAYIKYNAKSSGIVWFRPHHYMKTNRRLENWTGHYNILEILASFYIVFGYNVHAKTLILRSAKICKL